MADLGWDTSNLTLLTIGGLLCIDCCGCQCVEGGVGAEAVCGDDLWQSTVCVTFSGVKTCDGDNLLDINEKSLVLTYVPATSSLYEFAFFDSVFGGTIYPSIIVLGTNSLSCQIRVGQGLTGKYFFEDSPVFLCDKRLFTNELTSGSCGNNHIITGEELIGYDGTCTMIEPCND